MPLWQILPCMNTDIRVVTIKPRKRVKSAPGRKKREKSISALTKELDALVSRSVRLQAMDKNEMVECYTCGFQAHYKKIQCGHFISRFYKATRWNRDNLRPQCVMCNMWKRGDIITFREKLIAEIGKDKVERMEFRRHSLNSLDRNWLQLQINQEKKALEAFMSKNSLV